MADRIRRSGRATKGQNTKDRDLEDTKPNKRGNRKSASKSKNAQADDEEENEIIRCVCGQYEEEEDTQRDMICCDKCTAWQHNDCMLLPYPPDEAPDHYFCEQCKPEDHVDLLAAISRGETPWVEVARQREAAAASKPKKGKGGKRRRKSGTRPSDSVVDDTSEVEAQSHVAEQTDAWSGQKRKAEEFSAPVAQDAKKPRQSSGSAPSNTPANGSHPSQKRKSTSQPDPAEPSAGTSDVATTLDELPTPRRKVAASLIKLFTALVNDVRRQGKEALTAKLEGNAGIQLGLNVEHALYHTLSHGSGDPNEAYSTQVRTILFNVKKNVRLRDGVLSGSITSVQLAKMSPADMASKEQQMRDAKLKEEQEKQHIIVKEEGPRIRRTHKGDEYIDDGQQTAAESEVVQTPIIRRESNLGQDEVKSPTVMDSPTGPTSPTGKPLSLHTQARATPADPDRKSSQTFNIQNVWSSIQGSPDADRPAFPQIPYATNTPTPKTSAQADPDIDALLKDEDAESPPYSPQPFEDDSSIVWRGSIAMNSVASFHAHARKAAGADVESLGFSWGELLPSTLTVNGRIELARVNGYLCGLQYSMTADVTIICVRPNDTEHDRQQFRDLFAYFKSRNRYAVCMVPEKSAVRDVYLMPFEAGSTTKPELLSLLDNDTIETPIPEDVLIVTIVVRKAEPSTPRDAQGVAASPIAGAGAGAGAFQRAPKPPVLTPPPQSHHQPHPQPQPANPAAPAHSLPPRPGPPPQPQSQSQSQSQSQPHYSAPGSGPYPPPHHSPQPQQPQQHQSSSSYYPPAYGIDAANLILGPQTHLPAVQHLLKEIPNAGMAEMEVVKNCLRENPAAGGDVGVLKGMIIDIEGRVRRGQ